MSRLPQIPVRVWCVDCRTRLAVYLGRFRGCSNMFERARAATTIPMALRCRVCRTARAVRQRRCAACAVVFEQLVALDVERPDAEASA